MGQTENICLGSYTDFLSVSVSFRTSQVTLLFHLAVELVIFSPVGPGWAILMLLGDDGFFTFQGLKDHSELQKQAPLKHSVDTNINTFRG